MGFLVFSGLALASPSVGHYKDRHYIFVFSFLFSATWIQSTYHLLTASTVRNWDCVVTVVSFALVWIAVTTPQPLHPKDMMSDGYEKFEVKDGNIYRDNLPLSPEAKASVFSWITFQWMNPMVVFGFHNTITRDHLYALTFQHKAKSVYNDFIDTVKFISRKDILRRIYRSNKKEIWLQFLYSTAANLIGYLGPVFQQLFLGYFEDPAGRPIKSAYFYIFGLFLARVLKSIFDSAQLWVGRRWNVRLFIMLDAEIFAKTMTRKEMSGQVNEKSEKDDEKDDDDKEFSSVGKINNLMSVDAGQLSSVPVIIHMIYNAPLQIAVGVFYLYQLLGTAALVGLCIMILSFPVSTTLSKFYSDKYKSLSSARDKRNDLLNELLQGIRMVKYFTWEKQWNQKIKSSRNIEISQLIKVIILEITIVMVSSYVPVLVTVVTFVWYTKVAGNELTASVAFVSISLFQMLRGPLHFVPTAIMIISESKVHLNRIIKYLDEPDVNMNINNEPVEVPDGISPETVLARVGFEESVFQWHHKISSTDKKQNTVSASSSTTALNSIPKSKTLGFQLHVPRFNFPTSKLSLVIGATGSGKSSFLHALLGEMDVVSGRVYLPSKVKLQTENYSKIDPEYPSLYLDKVAYVAQQPFLQHASIRDNILFGLPYDEERYKQVLHQCALIKDLSILADGDLTEIGEKGISLSGGQKQRVSLARAVYSYAKTVLLDDCLSAVDAHTSKHIIKECILGNLFHGRTVILVTHHVKLCLPAAKFLVKIEQGNILGCDSIENLRKSNELLKLIGEELEKETDEDPTKDEEDKQASLDINLSDNGPAAKLIKEETSSKGQVKLKVYATYFAACGGWFFWFALLFVFAAARSLAFAEKWWLKVWAAAYTSTSLNNTMDMASNDVPFVALAMKESVVPPILDTMTTFVQNQNVFKSWVYKEINPVNVDYYIAIYSIIVSSYVLLGIIKNVTLFWGSILGARILFNNLVDRIIRAPMRFFDTTPVGRILNRFGKDISVIDIHLARSASHLLDCITGIIASIIVMSAITPEFIIATILIGGIYFIIGLLYLRASRELQRLNSLGLSPIYSHFTESLIGITTIRAYSVEEQFMISVYKKLDAFTSSFYFLCMSNHWLNIRIELIGAVITLFAGIFLTMNMDKIDAGLAGISLFYAQSFLEYVFWFIRQYTSVEMGLNSVERIQEYLEIDQEAPYIVEGCRPPAAWPTEGVIEVKDLTISYAPELDPILHGISFSTKTHEKVGIVGRTGSGKSTMCLSFFRFLEASKGTIIIDDVDIAKIGIEDLRTKLTIIPQDVVLFNGTIRSNLDPFDEHPDEAIWEALERAHLASPSDRAKALSSNASPLSSSSEGIEEDTVSSITSLSLKVSEGGNNFSQGQRQLLCLARALLRNSKVIIMDEATASVDFETDTKIQATIREEFNNSTLLCIAHRLRTVIDYDRIIVLDEGKLSEYDTPYNLLFNNTGNGIFKSMCEQSGEIDILKEMVQRAEDLKVLEN
ncbi:hypothetical protein G6F57_005470 [Rhizopus arrhizus]|nr:hypothetical protein G6F57_005470 [Rhizopus arrhizus]